MARSIQDEEIKGMIDFIATAHLSFVVSEALVTMLEEFRKKVRDVS